MDIVVCGGALCGSACSRWTSQVQDDDADLWKDLTLQNSIPDVKPPPVPTIVEVPSYNYEEDDISTLYNEPPHRRYKDDDDDVGIMPKKTNVPKNDEHDLELRLETIDLDDGCLQDDRGDRKEADEDFIILSRASHLRRHAHQPLPRRFFRNDSYDNDHNDVSSDDHDGSSYSSHRKTRTNHAVRLRRQRAKTSWQANSTETTMEASNFSILSFVRAH